MDCKDLSNFQCLLHLSFSTVILAEEKSVIQWIIFFLELIYEHLIATDIQNSFFSYTLKTSLLNLMDFQYFWNCSNFEIYEIDIIIYKCSAYLIEATFQMYFQKIYSFIKFRNLSTEFSQFKNWKISIFFLEILTFFAFLVL